MLITRGSLVRVQPALPVQNGGLAQLGEHLLCKQGVVGSIPSSSTITESTNVSQPEYRLRFRFDLLAIIAVSFFNNLEEVKFMSDRRKAVRWVVIVLSTSIALVSKDNKAWQRCTSYFYDRPLLFRQRGANVIGTSE